MKIDKPQEGLDLDNYLITSILNSLQCFPLDTDGNRLRERMNNIHLGQWHKNINGEINNRGKDSYLVKYVSILY